MFVFLSTATMCDGLLLLTDVVKNAAVILQCIGRIMWQKIWNLIFGDSPPRRPFILPPMTDEDVRMNKKTIVLDLDETLVHSSYCPPPWYDFTVRANWETVYVLKRPGVGQLLNELHKNFELVIFTAAVREYASAVVDRIDPHGTITHRLYRDSCSRMDGEYVKNLSMLGRDLRRTIIVDDNPSSYALHPQNGLPVRPFYDDLCDTELDLVLNFFKVAYDYEDIRQAITENVLNGFLP